MSERRSDRIRRMLERTVSVNALGRSAAIAVAFLVIICALTTVQPHSFASFALGLAGLILIGGVCLFWFRARIAYSKLEKLNFEVCPNCEYPLKGLPPEHRCPECGAPYEIGRVRKTWKETLRWAQDRPHRFPPGHCHFCGYLLTGPPDQETAWPHESGRHFCIGCKCWHEHRFPPGHCQHCGYNLTGNESGVCPECATPRDASRPEERGV